MTPNRWSWISLTFVIDPLSVWPALEFSLSAIDCWIPPLPNSAWTTNQDVAHWLCTSLPAQCCWPLHVPGLGSAYLLRTQTCAVTSVTSVNMIAVLLSSSHQIVYLDTCAIQSLSSFPRVFRRELCKRPLLSPQLLIQVDDTLQNLLGLVITIWWVSAPFIGLKDLLGTSL